MRFTSVTVASGVSFHLKVTILSFSSFTISFPFFFFFFAIFFYSLKVTLCWRRQYLHISLEFLSKEDLPFSPFISYLVIYLHWCGHMDMYSVYWSLIQCYSSLSCCSDSSSFGHWELCQSGAWALFKKKKKKEYNCFIVLC